MCENLAIQPRMSGDQRSMLSLLELVRIRMFGFRALAAQANSDKRDSHTTCFSLYFVCRCQLQYCCLSAFHNPLLTDKGHWWLHLLFLFYHTVPRYGWKVYDIVTVLKLSWYISNPCLEGRLFRSNIMTCSFQSLKKKNRLYIKQINAAPSLKFCQPDNISVFF